MVKIVMTIGIIFLFIGCGAPPEIPEHQQLMSLKSAPIDTPYVSFATAGSIDKKETGRLYSSTVDLGHMFYYKKVALTDEWLFVSDLDTIQVADPETGKVKSTLLESDYTIGDVFPNQDNLIISEKSQGPDVCYMSRYNLESGDKELLFKTIDRKCRIRNVTDDKLYVTMHGKLTLYDLKTRQNVKTFPTSARVKFVDVSPEFLVVGMDGDYCTVSDAKTYAPIATLSSCKRAKIHNNEIFYLNGFGGLGQKNEMVRYNIDTGTSHIMPLFSKDDLIYGGVVFGDDFFAMITYGEGIHLFDYEGKKLDSMPFPLTSGPFVANLYLDYHKGRIAVTEESMGSDPLELWDFSKYESSRSTLPAEYHAFADPAYPFESTRLITQKQLEAGETDKLKAYREAFGFVFGKGAIKELRYDREKKKLEGILASTTSEYEKAFHVDNVDYIDANVLVGSKESVNAEARFDIRSGMAKLDRITLGFNGKRYQAAFSDEPFISKTALKEQEEAKKLQELIANQKCRVAHEGWLYLDGKCRGGKVTGKGQAKLIAEEDIRYEGHFENGAFVKGKLIVNGERKWDGAFKGGNPDGKGICFTKGNPESCEFYEGKRVDALYMQRKEMAAMQAKLDAQEAKLKAYEKRLSRQNSGGNPLVNTIGQEVGKAAGKQIGKMIFDQLF